MILRSLFMLIFSTKALGVSFMIYLIFLVLIVSAIKKRMRIEGSLIIAGIKKLYYWVKFKININKYVDPVAAAIITALLVIII